MSSKGARGRKLTVVEELEWTRQIRRANLGPLALSVANFLTEKFNSKKAGWAYPSIETIAREIYASGSTARRAIRQLEKAGFIESKTGGGRGGANLYRPILKPHAEAEANEAETLSPMQGFSAEIKPETLAPVPGAPCHPCSETLSPMTPEPTYEPTKEPTEEKHSRKKAKRSDTKGRALPEDWRPSKENRAYARYKGLNDHDIDTEAEKFANYWLSKAGPGARKRNWDATWRNWCITATERHNGAARHKPRQSAQDSLRSAMADLLTERGSGKPSSAHDTGIAGTDRSDEAGADGPVVKHDPRAARRT